MKHRILYIVPSLEIGGLEKVTISLANNLKREGFETYICCISCSGELACTLKEKDKLFVVGNRGRINISSIKYILDLTKKLSIDLIHSHELPGLIYGIPVAMIRRIPIIYTKHGYFGSFQENFIVRCIEKLFSRLVSEYVCVSNELKERMKKQLGLKDKKVTVIYNGVDIFPRTQSPPSDKDSQIIIGSIGRLTKVKNYSLLINAFEEIKEEYPNCSLQIIGDGECRKKLDDLITQKSLSNCVHLAGYKIDTIRYLENFDIFVLTSLHEGHSISLLEALSQSKICLVSNVGGNNEIINDWENGFLFESKNKEDLVLKMKYILDGIYSESMNSIRKKALESFLSQYTMDTMIIKYEELYKKYLAE